MASDLESLSFSITNFSNPSLQVKGFGWYEIDIDFLIEDFAVIACWEFTTPISAFQSISLIVFSIFRFFIYHFFEQTESW